MIRLIIHNFGIAFDAIRQNKLRSVLTSLGIICGVASVIAMLAIGRGAQHEILEKMKLLGTNNIIVKAVDPDDKEAANNEEEDDDEDSQDITKKKKRFSPGLNMDDARSIAEEIPGVEAASPEIVMETMALREGFKYETKLVGVGEDYFEINNFEIKSGVGFSSMNFRNSDPVCIIGGGVRAKLFATGNPIGSKVKCGIHWLRVVGVLESKSITKENIKNLGIRDYNLDIYIPVNTMLLRYKNKPLKSEGEYFFGGNFSVFMESGAEPEVHQLDRIIVGIENTDRMRPIAEILSRMLFRRHNEEIDYEIVVPELLLEQEQRTKAIFNIVLGAIASISLIVGGIGIMNIMLASVLERTKEIGVRMAVGARKRDIMLQFLSEALTISLSGGLIGIFLGVALSLIIEKATDIPTIVSLYSVAISFIVSISVGIIFGLMPARRAALQEPIVSLRYE